MSTPDRRKMLEDALARFGRPEIFNTDSQRINASFRAA